MTGIIRFLKNALNLREGESRPFLYSFLYFFCLMAGYYMLRPLRDEMGIQSGVKNLEWLFTATFITMLAAVPVFGALVSRFPRRVFLPIVYHFFAACLMLFFLLFQSGMAQVVTARIFFVWTSVFNLFVISVFWSTMADYFSREQARRLFGVIAAGGTAGALAGPLIALTLSQIANSTVLLLTAAFLLECAVLCIAALMRHRKHAFEKKGKSPLGGGFWEGIRLVLRNPFLAGICLFLLLYTSCGTFLYFAQARIIAGAFESSADRTSVFAAMDFSVNFLTLFLQLFLAGRIMQRAGLAWSLASVPVLIAAGFAIMAFLPVLTVFVVFQVLRRAAGYGLTKPAREVLFTCVRDEEKYKAKNFIDTAVYRGGDVINAWAFSSLEAAGLSLGAMMGVGSGIAALWTATGFLLGRKYESLQNREGTPCHGS